MEALTLPVESVKVQHLTLTPQTLGLATAMGKSIPFESPGYITYLMLLRALIQTFELLEVLQHPSQGTATLSLGCPLPTRPLQNAEQAQVSPRLLTIRVEALPRVGLVVVEPLLVAIETVNAGITTIKVNISERTCSNTPLPIAKLIPYSHPCSPPSNRETKQPS